MSRTACSAAAREAVPRGRLLIAGTGRESTRATIAATRRAAALGADMVLVRTPSFFRSLMTPAVLVRHFTAVADASPVPVLLYNFPGQTGVNFAPDTIARLAEHANIAGVKETGTDAAQVAAFVDAAPCALLGALGIGAGILRGALRRRCRRRDRRGVRRAGAVRAAARADRRRTVTPKRASCSGR